MFFLFFVGEVEPKPILLWNKKNYFYSRLKIKIYWFDVHFAFLYVMENPNIFGFETWKFILLSATNYNLLIDIVFAF